MTIKITQKDAQALANAIARVTLTGEGDNLAVRAIIQSISQILPLNVEARTFRCIARGGVIDLSGRNYLAEINAKKGTEA